MLPPNEYGCVYVWTRLGNGPGIKRLKTRTLFYLYSFMTQSKDLEHKLLIKKMYKKIIKKTQGIHFCALIWLIYCNLPKLCSHCTHVVCIFSHEWQNLKFNIGWEKVVDRNILFIIPSFFPFLAVVWTTDLVNRQQ